MSVKSSSHNMLKKKDSRGKELGVVLAGDLGGEVLGRQLVLVALGGALLQLLRLLLQQLQGVVLVELLALGGRHAVLAPLPQLRARDLRRRGVLHQVVDRHAADAAQPALHVSEPDVEVLADALLRDLAGDVHVEQVLRRDLHFLAADVELVGRWHVLVEHLGRDGGERRVRDPGAVVARADLAELVGAHVLHGFLVGLLVVLDGDLGRHAAHGVHAAAVAGLDEELDVGVHEGHGHGDGAAVGEDEVGVLAEALDDGEDVVPAAAVEAGRVVAELVDDLGEC